MKQKQALDILKAGRNVYLTGAAGSGKTYVLNEYINYLKHRGIGVGVTASTGIAATHIGGVTIHSWSGVGIKDELSEYDIEKMGEKEYLWKRFEKTKVLIMDEVSMLSPKMFDSVEKVCRIMKRKDEPFGGMQVVLSGDFFQLPPIVRDGSDIEFINSSEAWRNMDIRVCYLDEQFRQKDNSLESILKEMRSGEVSFETREKFKDFFHKKFNSDITPTRLYTHNVDVDALNERELEALSGGEVSFEMHTKGRGSLVESLKKSLLAPVTLRLKKNAVVMFVKNNFNEGYVNGTLGIVEDFVDGMPVVRTFSGDKIYVSSTEWNISENDKILASVEQLPLRLAWAITIHKSQGMSMDAAEIDLSKSFVAGQGYVALSRLRTLKGLSLLGINDMAFAVHPHILELDRHLLYQSSKWERVIGRFSDEDVKKMHDSFVLKSGGTIDKKEILKNSKKEKEVLKDKISTYEKTRIFLEQNLSLQDIAKEREMTLGTIVSHLEKLKEMKVDVDLERFKPKEKDLDKIKEAFEKMDDTKLAPVYGKLGGKYSYEEIRIARLFLDE